MVSIMEQIWETIWEAFLADLRVLFGFIGREYLLMYTGSSQDQSSEPLLKL